MTVETVEHLFARRAGKQNQIPSQKKSRPANGLGEEIIQKCLCRKLVTARGIMRCCFRAPSLLNLRPPRLLPSWYAKLFRSRSSLLHFQLSLRPTVSCTCVPAKKRYNLMYVLHSPTDRTCVLQDRRTLFRALRWIRYSSTMVTARRNFDPGIFSHFLPSSLSRTIIIIGRRVGAFRHADSYKLRLLLFLCRLFG